MRFLPLVVLTLLPSFSLASPAHDYLSEVGRYLRAYNGPSSANPTALMRAAERELDRRCASSESCSLTVGRDVAQKLVEGFQDKHTNLKDPRVAERARAEIRGEDVRRIGIRLIPAGSAAIVGYVRPDSPAARSGLKGGELITAINGNEPKGTHLIAAENAGEARLQLTTGEVMIRSQLLPARDYPSLRRVNGVNVINIPSFLGEGVARSFFETLNRIDPTEPLIVDVRANGGGSLSECLLAASAFGEAKHQLTSARYTVRYAARSGTLYANDKRMLALGPVTAPPANRVSVLVSERTASCGEVFAGAMQKLGATVVGTPTAGVKNSAVGLYDLSDGSMLSVTTSTATTAEGLTMDARVKPTVEVTLVLDDVRAGRDPVLEMAILRLGSTAGQ